MARTKAATRKQIQEHEEYIDAQPEGVSVEDLIEQVDPDSLAAQNEDTPAPPAARGKGAKHGGRTLVAYVKGATEFTNPKRGKSALRFEGYRDMLGRTVEDIVANTAVTMADIRWDVEHNNITLS